MAFNSPSHTLNHQAKRTSFSGLQSSNATLLLDRSKPGIRGSTPDSEALASSDDEQDHLHRLHPVVSNPGPRPTRRSSWLAEGQQALNRKSSMGASGHFSPVSPSAPLNDHVSWGTNTGPTTGASLSRGHSNSTSIPWGSTIWNNDSQKCPPQRLTEVLPSPTSMGPPVSAPYFQEEPLQSPPASRDNVATPAIPFAIPLHPTLKTYRSQSYSVGQQEPESTNSPISTYANYVAYGRPRNGAAYSGLHHRPSRLSMLGDSSHDPSLLGQLQEVEDDETSSNNSTSGALPPTKASIDPSRKMEQLSRENFFLRQTLAGRNVVGSPTAQLTHRSGLNTQNHLRDSLPEDPDFALCELDESDTHHIHSNEGRQTRRFSEYSTKHGVPHTGALENRTLESVKKGHWQSSLGFSGVGEPPQSRRHSFADVPTRQNSIGSTGDPLDVRSHISARQESPAGYSDTMARPSQGESGEYHRFHLSQPFKTLQEQALEREHLRHRDFAVNYFSRTDPNQHNDDLHGPLSSSNLHPAYLQSQHNQPSQLALASSQHRSNQLLYLVTFKCQRADVFYVQDGTGLHVSKGDLVIVEADRGMDLGTVATDHMHWGEARETKDAYMRDHHKWLMIFSRHTKDGTLAGPNPNGQPQPPNSGGGIGGSPGHANVHEVPTGEMKPKMIRRLAQNHEIQTLREKEGAEAKAKRVCAQKVVEHRLNMEILDAEFQMDWKKLTFFYFADSYINFNPLVTDLFKIYKTRIWMSAINTAAIGGPNGTQHPSGGGLGHNIFGLEADEYGTRRHRQVSTSTAVSQATLATFDHAWDHPRDGAMANGMAFPQPFSQPFQGFDMQQYPIDYRSVGQTTLNLPPVYHGHGYETPPLRHTSSSDRRDWTQAFQGLSLGQR